MASDYPGALDVLVNPTSTTARNAGGGLALSEVTSNANDAIEAIQATLGVDPQGSESTVADRLDAIEGGGGGGGGGLVLIDSDTFTTVSPVNVDGVFDSTYDDYALILSLVPSTTSVTVTMRLRASSTDATASNYQGERHVIGVNTVANESGTDRWQALLCDSATTSRMKYDIFAPALTEPTSFIGFGHSYYAGIGFYFGYGASGHYTATTAFDGFSLLVSSGTITGRWAVYGYAK